MTREQAQRLVYIAILDHAGITPGSYQLTDSVDSLGFDSLDKVQVLCYIEDMLHIEHLEGAEKLDKIKIIDDLVDLVEKQTMVIQ